MAAIDNPELATAFRIVKVNLRRPCNSAAEVSDPLASRRVPPLVSSDCRSAKAQHT